MRADVTQRAAAATAATVASSGGTATKTGAVTATQSSGTGGAKVLAAPGAGSAAVAAAVVQNSAIEIKKKSEGVRAMLGLNAASRTGPMWENEAFIDLFLDGYNPHKRHGLSKGFAKDAAAVLMTALQGASDEWAESLAHLGDTKKAAVQGLSDIVQDFHDLCRCLPSKSKSEQQCLEFVHGIITRIKALPAGAHIMVPGGWVETAEDFSLIFIVERVGTERLTLAVCNSGPDGLGYHPIKADLVDTANMKYKMSMVFEDVPDARLCDSSFWFLAARMHVWPGETHNAKMLYEMLLPALNHRTLAATQALNNDDSLPSTGWSVPPQGGDSSFIYCMLEACELVLARRGLSQQERAAWTTLVRWQVVRELNAVGHGQRACGHLSASALAPAQMLSVHVVDAWHPWLDGSVRLSLAHSLQPPFIPASLCPSLPPSLSLSAPPSLFPSLPFSVLASVRLPCLSLPPSRPPTRPTLTLYLVRTNDGAPCLAL